MVDVCDVNPSAQRGGTVLKIGGAVYMPSDFRDLSFLLDQVIRQLVLAHNRLNGGQVPMNPQAGAGGGGTVEDDPTVTMPITALQDSDFTDKTLAEAIVVVANKLNEKIVWENSYITTYTGG